MTNEHNWISIVKMIVETAQSVGIDNVIIEPDCIRAIDDAKTVVLFQNEDVPQISVGSIGMNRIGIFMQRYNTISNQPNPTFTSIIDEKNGYVRSIVMKSDNLEMVYRCANPDTIQAPRKINDTPFYRILIPSSSGSLLKQLPGAMNSEIVEITSKKKGVIFKLIDINNDHCIYDLPEKAVNIEDEDASALFSYKYPVKNILSVIDSNADTMFEIGEKGIITASVNRLNVLILPQV